MLDVEYPTCKLYIEELCQLVEDIPIFTWDEEGNRSRRTLLLEYRTDFARYAGKPDDLDEKLVWQSYLAFSALLGLFGMSLSANHLARTSLTPIEEGKWESRRDDYMRLARNAVGQLIATTTD